MFVKKKTARAAAFVATFILAIALLCVVYLGDFYPADTAAIAAFLPTAIEPQKSEQGTLVFAPKDANTGLIFYPGGKVEHTAYVPLMNALASRGILCVLTEMPFHLAVFDINAADGIQEQYPQIENWYIGGHSLGGAMAASYVSTHADTYQGLVLLGAYSTADLTGTDLQVLSVYGSEDNVMDLEAYEANRKNLPKGAVEIVIEGGCHAYFGMYGAQEGDGTPTITNSEQIAQTADALVSMVEELLLQT